MISVISWSQDWRTEPGFFFFLTRLNISYQYPTEEDNAGQLTPYRTSCTWDLNLKRSIDVISSAALENTFFLFFPLSIKKLHVFSNSFGHV